MANGAVPLRGTAAQSRLRLCHTVTSLLHGRRETVERQSIRATAMWREPGLQTKNRQARPGEKLGGARFRIERIFLAQPATDGARVDVEKLSGAQPITPRMLENSTDNGIV